MKPSTMRKVLFYAGNTVCILATVVLLGCVVAWQIGPELLSKMYQSVSPLLPYRFAALGLLAVGLLLLALGRDPGAAGPGQGKVRCPRCQALNDGAAKYCNQCGGPMADHLK